MKEKNKTGRFAPRGWLRSSGTAVAIGLILRGFLVDCVRVGALPGKLGRRYAMKMERYLLLAALAIFALLVLLHLFYKR